MAIPYRTDFRLLKSTYSLSFRVEKKFPNYQKCIAMGVYLLRIGIISVLYIHPLALAVLYVSSKLACKHEILYVC